MGISFSFLHAADLHLDSPFRGLSRVPSAVRERLKESTFASLRRLAKLARREKVDFVVLSGDLYDAADRSLRAQLRLQRILADLADDGIQVFAVHGNHDPESGWQAKLEWPEKVAFFGSSEVEAKPAYRRDGQLAAYVYGISYAESRVTDNLAARYRIRPEAPFHIALLHANVDGSAGHDNYAPCRLSELTSGDFHYWALGHVHDRRVLAEAPHVVYPGNIQGRSMRETGPKGAYLVRVGENGGVSLTFLDSADVLWTEKRVSIEGAESEQELRHRLVRAAEEARRESGERPVVLRIRLEGRGPLHARLQRETTADEWLEELREWCGPPEERDDWLWPESLLARTGSPAEEAALADEDGFAGELARFGRETASDDRLAGELLDAALGPAFRHPLMREWAESLNADERRELVRRAAELAAGLLRREKES